MDYLEPVNYRAKEFQKEGYRRGSPIVIGGRKKEENKKDMPSGKEKKENESISSCEYKHHSPPDRISIQPDGTGISWNFPSPELPLSSSLRDFEGEILELCPKNYILSLPADCQPFLTEDMNCSPFFIFNLITYLSQIISFPGSSLVSGVISYFILLFSFSFFISYKKFDLPAKPLILSSKKFEGSFEEEKSTQLLYKADIKTNEFPSRRGNFGYL